MTDYTPALTGLSRVFIIEGGARPDHVPQYKGCMRAGAPSQSFGSVTRLECPSPDAYNEWDVIAETQGATESPTIGLSGHYALDLISDMLKLARRKCAFDLHVHFGQCTNPSDFTKFTKALIFENAHYTDWGADELGALQSADSVGVMETADIEGRLMYEVVPLSVAAQAASVVVNPLNDVIMCSFKECGDCDDEDDGCYVVLAVGDSTPGSPGTSPDVVWTKNKGTAWAADDIGTLDAAENADAIACVGNYVVVVSNDDGGCHYKLRATLLAGTAFAWTRIATGIAALGPPNDIWSVGTRAFICGDAGYIYRTDDITGGVTELDAGTATAQNLNVIKALDQNFVVAAGDSAAIVRSTNGSDFVAMTAPTGLADNITALHLASKTQWLIGTDAGEVYYTTDGADTWTQLTKIPVTLTAVNDIHFHNKSVGYIAGAKAGPAGVILRTYDGGQSWITMPEGLSALPANDAIYSVWACKHDENFFAACGLGDDAADGVLLLGTV